MLLFPTQKKDLFRYLDGTELIYEMTMPATMNNITFYILYHLFCDQALGKHRKFSSLNRIVERNQFLNAETKEEVLDFFNKTQRIYWSLNRVAFRWKFKRANVAILTDIFLNHIDPNKAYNFCLYQGKTKYFFKNSDLLTIILNSCTAYRDSFELSPKCSKNPYTNQSLEPVHMYRFYFHLRLSQMKIPLWFELFFEEGFNLIDFTLKHETLLKKIAIQKYVANSDVNHSIIRDIHTMFKSHCLCKKLHIDLNFPDEVLLQVCRPYIYLYYLVHFLECDTELHTFYDTKLQQALSQLALSNPFFGQKKKTVCLFPRSPWKPSDHVIEFVQLTKQVRTEYHTSAPRFSFTS